jgi:putative ABC transport system permease protein
MRIVDIIRAAMRNSFRSRLRTTLTIVAIFIGAFTLTITNGLGTGINTYIDTQLGALGADGVMTVTKTIDETPASDGPVEYDPEAAAAVSASGSPGTSVLVMNNDDLTALRAITNVDSVDAALSVYPDFVAFESGTRYQLGVSAQSAGIAVVLVAGDSFEPDAATPELVLTTDYVEPLGFTSNADAVGRTVTLGITDANGEQHELSATVAGVQEPSLLGASIVLNTMLTSELYDAQSTGLPSSASEDFSQATLRFDPALDATAVSVLKADLTDAGYTGTTVADQLGTFTSIIDGIILVLNAFAIIALIAAGFGIINTLLMSVQERTREIGLMKAMGMSGGRIFALFSLEAVFIGFLGSAIGAVVAMGVGTLISGVLANGLLSELAGLQLLAFTPASILSVLLLVMGIAFVAAVLPASRAARQSPIDSLRYE